ncbi:T9SS type A sorting domain-containing protein [bacterium]|nr:T9SS type A sorting domain-containing protein [bacterium]
MSYGKSIVLTFIATILLSAPACAGDSILIWEDADSWSLSESGDALPCGDNYFFVLNEDTYGAELYITDGSGGFCTTLVKDINPSGASDPEYGVILNGVLYFAADDGTNGIELWKSDGTESGTTLVKDIMSGSSSSNPEGLTLFDGKIYFAADGGTDGAELWVTDGTESGTQQVADICSESGSSSPTWLTECNGTLFFNASDGSNGYELWKTDGTESGTAMVKDIESGSSSSNPTNLADVDGTLIFYANGQLACSDGTEIGTDYLEDSGAESLFAGGDEYCVWDGYYYFDGMSDEEIPQLWRTDGTPSGSGPVSEDLFLEFMGESMYATDTKLFFVASDPAYGCELRVTNGSTISLVEDITPSGDSMFIGFVVMNNTLYFAAYDGMNAYIYRSDGTSAGTYDFTDPTGTAMASGNLVDCGDILLFGYLDTDGELTIHCYSWAPNPQKSLDRNKWRMVGIPVNVTADQTGDSFFQNDLGDAAPNGSNWCMSQWSPENDCYIRLCETDSDGSDHGDPEVVTPGQGYWIIQDVYDSATLVVDDDQEVGMCVEDDEPPMVLINNPSEEPEYRGLTMMANPFMQPYEMMHSCFITSSSPEVIMIEDFIAIGGCNANIYTWDPNAGAAGQYETVAISEAILDPWEGFWFEEYEPINELIFCFLSDYWYDDLGSHPEKMGDDFARTTDTASSWTLDLPVRSVDGAFLDEYNRIGVGENFDDSFDQYDGSEFNPMGGRFVQAYFDHPEWSTQTETFTFDLRSTDFTNGPKEWDYTVRTWRLGNREFEIVWPGISDVPTEYQFTLIDNSTGAPAEMDMRDRSSLRFQTGPHTGDYELHSWTIRVEKTFITDTPEITLVPSSYDFQSPYPNPFNPTAMLTIALPEAGDLTVQVFNMLGQQVAILADGKVSAGYQKFVLDATSLASGTYLVRAQVPGELNVTKRIQLIK